MVGTRRLHSTLHQYRPPRRRQVPLLHALPRRQRLLEHRCLPEIIPLQRIVSTDSFADEKGNVVPASHYGMPSDVPMEMQVTVTFEELGGKTRMTLRHVGIPAGEQSKMAEQGWNMSFDKLAKALK